jgi:hypothetical protein
MTLDELFIEFEAAHKAGDRDRMVSLINRVPDPDTDAFLARVTAAGLGPKSADVAETQAADIESALEATGMNAGHARSMSILVAGSFAEFVRDRMVTRGIDADSIVRRIDDGEAGEADLDDGDEAIVRAWVAAVMDGDDDPEVELPDGAMELLAAALESTPNTILALRERG